MHASVIENMILDICLKRKGIGGFRGRQIHSMPLKDV